MNVGNVTAMSKNYYKAIASCSNKTSKFVIPQSGGQQSESRTAESKNVSDIIKAMESMTGKAAAKSPVNAPSYTVTEEEAEYFREKYGEEFDEEKPYQIFYELAQKNIISTDDAGEASGYGCMCLLESSREIMPWEDPVEAVNSGSVKLYVVKECYSNSSWLDRYYDKFQSNRHNEIKTWKDAAKEQYDFHSYLINTDEELLTPLGTPFQSSREEMNSKFAESCEGILKVINVLDQIFGE